mmetsp:Transcript_10195/g.31358  ORF Transcript_10195/g.31358 Transcript_10195/m.31358 type:complete len:339 (-) Transcript_10195:724-1740(-)
MPNWPDSELAFARWLLSGVLALATPTISDEVTCSSSTSQRWMPVSSGAPPASAVHQRLAVPERRAVCPSSTMLGSAVSQHSEEAAEAAAAAIASEGELPCGARQTPTSSCASNSCSSSVWMPSLSLLPPADTCSRTSSARRVATRVWMLSCRLLATRSRCTTARSASASSGCSLTQSRRQSSTRRSAAHCLSGAPCSSSAKKSASWSSSATCAAVSAACCAAAASAPKRSACAASSGEASTCAVQSGALVANEASTRMLEEQATSAGCSTAANRDGSLCSRALSSERSAFSAALSAGRAAAAAASCATRCSSTWRRTGGCWLRRAVTSAERSGSSGSS